MSLRLGNFVAKSAKSFLNSRNGLSKGLLNSCCSNYTSIAKDNHHHGGALISTEGTSVNGIKTFLFKQNNNNNYNGFVRHYSNKIQSTPTPKELLHELCQSELKDFDSLLPQQTETQNEVKQFLEENAYTLKETKEQGSEVVILNKTYADGTQISIKFDAIDQFDENYDDENLDENQEENENEENEEENENEEDNENEENEENENGNEENDAPVPHDHAFEIQVTTSKGKTLTFGCFASQDGNYTISAFYGGSFDDVANPVDISGTSSDFQDNILLLLQQYGVNEKLSFFIHDYIHHKKLNDYIQTFESLKDFVSRK